MRKFSLFLTILLCLCASTAHSTVLSITFDSEKKVPATSYTSSDGVVFYFENNITAEQQSIFAGQKGQIKVAKEMEASFKWSSIAPGGAITITSFSVRAGMGGNNTWELYTNLPSAVHVNHSGKDDYTLTLDATKLLGLTLNDWIIIKAGGSECYIKEFSITYTATPATYYFGTEVLGNKPGNYYTSFTANSFSSTSDTKSVVGASVQADNAEATAYFTAAAQTDDGWNFEGWYLVDANGDPTETQYSDQLSCSMTFSSDSYNSGSPDECKLYARYTDKQVPTFSFDMKIGVVGQPTYQNVFTSSNSAALSSVTNSDDEVATVTYNLSTHEINVTALKKGHTTIEITQDGDEDNWVTKTQSYIVTVVNQGEWIWAQDIVSASNSYYLYSTVSGFLNDNNGFDNVPTILWTIGGTPLTSYTLTSSNSKMVAIYDESFQSNISSNKTDKSGDDVLMASSLEDGYFSLYRSNVLKIWGITVNRNVYTVNGGLAIQADASYEWVFVSPAQVEASEAYVEASTYIGKYTTLYPALNSELSAVLAANNYTSNNWVTCKANLDAIIAKCEAFDEDYAKFTANEISLTPTTDGFATFYSACPVALPSGVTAFKGDYSEGTLTLTDIDRSGKVPACTPVILHNDDNSNSTIVLTYDGSNNDSPVVSDLHGSSYDTMLDDAESTVTMDGKTGTAFALGYKNSTTAFYKYSSTATKVSANKAILIISGGNALVAGIRILSGDNNATNIESINANVDVIKFFENGQLFIKRDGIVYDALGRIVK